VCPSGAERFTSSSYAITSENLDADTGDADWVLTDDVIGAIRLRGESAEGGEVFVGIGRLELFIPESGSLKSKRHVVKGIVGGLRAKFNVAVAEIGHQDLWQRTSLGLTCVSESPSHTEKMLQEMERWVARDTRIEILDCSVFVMQPEE
jgi:uncharacterized protein